MVEGGWRWLTVGGGGRRVAVVDGGWRWRRRVAVVDGGWRWVVGGGG